jgi:hypothetical protein
MPEKMENGREPECFLVRSAAVGVVVRDSSFEMNVRPCEKWRHGLNDLRALKAP